MSRRPSIDTISTYQTRDYRYGYASQNGSFYSGSVGSQELIDMYGDEDSVFTDDRWAGVHHHLITIELLHIRKCWISIYLTITFLVTPRA